MANNRIKDALRELGVSQAELAMRLGVSRAAVTLYCQHPTLTTLNKIADALGCSVRELLPDDGKVVEKRKVEQFSAMVVVDGEVYNLESPDDCVMLCKGIELE